eukprot:Gb_06055 [translate_table: standard]
MEAKIEMEKWFRMNVGKGENSYAENSEYQKGGIVMIQPKLEESISKMKTLQTKTFCIVDLGCSSGPNTLLATETMVKAVESKYHSEGLPVPELQVFLNDLPSNDFNSVFNILPPLVDDVDKKSHDSESTMRSYFVAGVPGSFYGRLFPKNSIHFVHSSYCLHWLSQVPDEVQDKNSEAWNKHQIFVSNQGSRVVAEAYVRQFQKDFNTYLKARAQELVPGGRMFLLFLGRTCLDPMDQGISSLGWQMLGIALNDLVSKRLIEKEKLESFNLPTFSPCLEEVANVVEREGSFKIERLEVVRRIMPDVEKELMKNNKEAYARMITKRVRAVVESLIENHFGGEVIDQLFETYAQIFAQGMSGMFKEEGLEIDEVLVVLENGKQE